MSGVAAPAPADERARAAAEAAAVGRLLNIYARESGGEGLRTATDGPVPPEVDAVGRQVAGVGQLAWLPLPAAGAMLVAPLAVRSAIGHHRLAGPVWIVPASRNAGGATVVESAVELAGLLAADLLAGAAAGEEVDCDPVAAIRQEVASSIDRCTRYVADRLGDSERVHPVDAPDPTLAAEATLAFGHPFHPSPKLADGFSPDDADDYAPELSHGFPLWWIAAPRELVTEELLPAAEPPPIPPEVTAAARARLGPSRAPWQLVPCHPWQARTLAARDDLAGALDDGTIRLLGPLGPDVRPTSSVRTVRQPDGSFWKLSLDVRITNFVRHNTPEQVRRTLDAGRIVTALPPRLRSGRLEILPDTAYRALALPGADELTTATAVLHRPAPGPAPAPAGACQSPHGTPPMVVAGLVEPDPHDGAPALARLLAVAAGAADLPVGRIGRRWLRAYLRISLRPLLRLLLDQGISLEAHTQNSLAGFADGWPSRLVVRDLEGTSVDRTHPLAAAHRRLLGSDGSPVLYAPEEAWQRFAYYVVVNHIGQVVATVAAETAVGEEELWAEVAALVRAEAAAASGPPADHLRAALLGPHLPAKANLVSRLLGRSERPLYVDIPNPCAAT